MGIVSRIGQWLDGRFPVRVDGEVVLVALQECRAKFEGCAELFERYGKRLEKLEDQMKVQEEMKSDLTKIKAIMQLKQTQRINMPNLTGSEPWKR